MLSLGNVERMARPKPVQGPIATRVRALRNALELKQEEVADATGVLSRAEVNKVENGWNKLRAARVRDALADGLRFQRLDFERYAIKGTLSLPELLARRGVGASAAPSVEGLPAAQAAAVQWAASAGYPAEVLARAAQPGQPPRDHAQWIDTVRGWKADHDAGKSAPTPSAGPEVAAAAALEAGVATRVSESPRARPRGVDERK